MDEASFFSASESETPRGNEKLAYKQYHGALRNIALELYVLIKLQKWNFTVTFIIKVYRKYLFRCRSFSARIRT
jgi:hypothetical protein